MLGGGQGGGLRLRDLFQAFQFVLWADRSPREAIAFAAFETRGAA